MQELDETRRYIAGEVRAALARDGRSGAQLSKDAGVAPSALHRKLKGITSFTVEEIVSVAVALDVDPASFVAGVAA